jgi:hypothetical protein
MTKFFVILTLLISTKIFGQTEEIYRLTFSDRSNFKLTTCLQHKLPQTFFILDTTDRWNYNRFWLRDFDSKDKKSVIKEIESDEHHPYFHSYLFSVTALNRKFSDKTKQKLCNKSKELRSRFLKLNASNYKTISSEKNLKGFYFVVSEPIFSDDKNFAFIDLTVYYKEKIANPLNETYFGSIAIVFEKQKNGWKRIAKKDWLFL